MSDKLKKVLIDKMSNDEFTIKDRDEDIEEVSFFQS